MIRIFGDDPEGEYYGGRFSPSSLVQDWMYDVKDFVQKVRKLIVCDVGDPPDLAIRRIGPDGAPHDLARQFFQALGHFQNVGSIYWQAFNGEGFGARNACIYVRTDGPQSPSNAGGSLHLAVSPRNAGNDGSNGNELGPVDRLVIWSDGTLDLTKVKRITLPDGTVLDYSHINP